MELWPAVVYVSFCLLAGAVSHPKEDLLSTLGLGQIFFSSRFDINVHVLVFIDFLLGFYYSLVEELLVPPPKLREISVPTGNYKII